MNGTSIQQSTMLDTTATGGFSRLGGAQPLAEKEQASMLEVIIEQDDERFAAHRRLSSVTSFDLTMDIRDGSLALNTPNALTSAQKLILAGAPQGPFEMRPNQYLNKVQATAAKYCQVIIEEEKSSSGPSSDKKSAEAGNSSGKPLTTEGKEQSKSSSPHPTEEAKSGFAAVDLVLKQGRISLGDDELFEIAAKDTQYFLLSASTSDVTQNRPTPLLEKHLILDYFSPARVHE